MVDCFDRAYPTIPQATDIVHEIHLQLGCLSGAPFEEVLQSVRNSFMIGHNVVHKKMANNFFANIFSYR